MFQLEIGQTVILPFVNACKFGIIGLDYDVLVLTDHICNGKIFCKVGNSLENSRYQNLTMNDSLFSLDCVTEFDIVLNKDNVSTLKQLSIACPNLQRLNVNGNIVMEYIWEDFVQLL